MKNSLCFLPQINKILSFLGLFLFFISTQITSFAVTAPTSPLTVEATPGNAIASVAFTAGGTGGSPIISYTVTSNPGNLTATGIGSPITVAGLTNGTAYTFTVTATNALGTSPASAASAAVTPNTTINSVTAVVAPSAPTILTATALTGVDAGKATVTFTPLGTAPTNYIVSATPTAASIAQGAVSATSTGTGSAGSPLTVTGLTAGATYSFTVTAVTTNFSGPASSSINSIAIPTILPTAPASVNATPGNASIAVTWTLPSPVYGGSAITGYSVIATPAGGSPVVTTVGNVLNTTLTGLTNGTAYTISVAALNANGTGTSLSANSIVTPAAAATAPGAPTNLVVVPGDTIASAAFTAPSSNGGSAITSYTVTAVPASGGGGNKTGTGATSPIMVTSLTNGIVYTLSVTATNGVNTGTASSTVTATPASSTTISLPGAPTSVVATAQVNASSVAFTTPSVPAIYSGGFSYLVTSASSTNGAALPQATGTASPIIVSGLTPGASYTFTVTASGVANGATFIGAASSASSAVSAPALPAAPVSVNAVAGNNQILVTWTAGSAGGSALTGYTITATPTNGGSPTSVILSGASITTYTISSLVNGVTYNVTVAQNSAVGTGPVLASSAVTPSTVPSAPTSVTALAGDSIITANWTPTPIALNGGSVITGYTITTTPTSGSAVSVSVPSTTAAVTIPGLTNGTAYTVSVVANNAASGSSSAALAPYTYTPGAVPGLPNNLTAAAGNTQATVTWTAPTSSGGSAITNYTVTATPSLGSVVTLTVGNVSTATLTGLVNGTAYTISVSATNSIGTGTPATAGSQVTPGTTPLAPTNVATTSTSGTIVVTWTVPASNGGAAITSYTVTLTPQVGSPIINTYSGASTSTATITGLTNGTNYGVSVVANNVVGASASASAASLAVPSTTPNAATSVTATARNTSITVTWIAPSSNGGASITGYVITATPTSGSAVVSNVSGAYAGTYTITGLQNGMTYTITLVARNVNGSSPSASASSTATPFAPYSFSTLAGLAGSVGSADNSGSSARFSVPVGIVSNGSGILYIADRGNSVIRKITNGGIVTTIAGTAGVVGSFDATGANASFNRPSALVIDSSGNIYVADSGNSTIRKIDVNGVVTTIAGAAGFTGSTDGTGVAARFNTPNGITIDSSGNLYVSDTGNSTIRKIDVNRVVTTIAGAAGVTGTTNSATGTLARFNQPTGITIDASNNLYVADTNNDLIRKISSGGVVTTVAGTASTVGSVDGTGTAALFYAPSGVAIDTNGNIYVVDTNNSTIRKITSAGVVTTLGGVAGTIGSADGISSQALFSNPSAIAVDGSGNLYVSDTLNDTIRIGTQASLPYITGQPISQVADYAATISLNVSATSPLALTYQWFKNGVPINGATSASYSIGSASSTDTGTYSVTVSNAAGSVSSSSANLIIITSVPSISSQPVNQSVTVGSSVTFSVTAVGVPTPTYQWQVNGIAISGATNSTYTILSAQLSDAAAYSVIISNSQGSVTSTSATLVVSRLPLAVTTAPTSQSVTYGTPANFNVAVAGTGPFTYQWYLNGTAISGATSSTYSITSALLNQVGNYTVSITDAVGTVVTSAAASLYVSAVPPAITTQPLTQAVYQGAPANLVVVATGTAPLTYQWYLNGTLISGATQSSYSIPVSASSNSGNYTVSVTNVIGSVTSASAALNVLAPPVVTTSPLTQTVAQGQPVTLSVSASGVSNTYQWFLNGVAISGATSANYSITSSAAANTGTYTVSVTNGAGTVTSSQAILTVLTNPGRLVNLSVLSMDGPGNQLLTIGFASGGAGTTGQQQLLVRGTGPALSSLGVTNILADPTLTVFNSSTTAIATNDDWGTPASNITIINTADSATGAFALSSSTSKDAALVTSVSPGPYTVQLAGKSGATGNALAEIYDNSAAGTYTATSPRLINISCLEQIGLNGMLTAGFSIGGTTPIKVLIRASGPVLNAFNIASPLADPTMTVYQNSTPLVTNSAWAGDTAIAAAATKVGAFPFPNALSKDSAALITLNPGQYTVQVKSVSGVTGITLIEVYEVPAQ